MNVSNVCCNISVDGFDRMGDVVTIIVSSCDNGGSVGFTTCIGILITCCFICSTLVGG